MASVVSESSFPVPSQSGVAQTLERLRHENNAQESVLRSLKADLLPRSFSSSSSMRAAIGPAITYFHIPTVRQWGFEFQTLCAAPLSSMDAGGVAKKIDVLNSFLRAFESAMVALSKQFLDQYLGEADTDLATESSPIPNGITIALLDCEDRSHISLAAKEQAAQYRLLAQQVGYMHTPLVCVVPKVIVSWKGRHMVVSADTIACSEPMPIDECFELRVVMDLSSETLHLKRYSCDGGVGEEQKGSGPANATAIKGSDGRVYAHNIQCLYPHFPPARGAVVDPLVHKVHLRSELVSLSKDTRHALSPAAFVVCGASDSVSCNTDVRDAAAGMCQLLIPSTVTSLLESPPDSPAALNARLHAVGINLSCLGIVFANASSPLMAKRDPQGAKLLATMVFTEMCARALRDVVQLEMSQRLESAEISSAVGEIVAELAGDVGAYYTSNLVPILNAKFVGFASLAACKSLPNNLTTSFLSGGALVSRALQLLGVSLAKPLGANAVLSTDPSAYDVTSISPVAKRLTIPMPINNKVLMTAAEGNATNANSTNKGLASRLDALHHNTIASAKGYLAGRDAELGAKGLFAELSSVQLSSSYIYACYDMVLMLNGTPSSGSYPTDVESLQPRTGSTAVATSSDAASAVALAKEAIAIASDALTLISTSPMTSGVVLLRALLKYQRAIARVRLSATEGSGDAARDAMADLSMAFALLAPSVKLAGAQSAVPPSLISPRTEVSTASINTPRTPPAGTFPVGKGAVESAFKYSRYAADIGVMWAAMLTSRGQHADALPLLEYAVQACTAIYGAMDGRTAAVMGALAANGLARSDLGLAEKALRDAIAMVGTSGADEGDPAKAAALSQLLTNLAAIVDRRGSSDVASAAESDALHARNIALVGHTYGPSHPYLALAHNNYAAGLIRRCMLAEADEQLTQAISILRKVSGTRPTAEVAETLSNIATLRRHQGRMDEAKASWVEALSNYEAVLPMSSHDLRLIPILENLVAWATETGSAAEKAAYEGRIAAARKANGVSV